MFLFLIGDTHEFSTCCRIWHSPRPKFVWFISWTVAHGFQLYKVLIDIYVCMFAGATGALYQLKSWTVQIIPVYQGIAALRQRWAWTGCTCSVPVDSGDRSALKQWSAPSNQLGQAAPWQRRAAIVISLGPAGRCSCVVCCVFRRSIKRYGMNYLVEATLY